MLKKIARAAMWIFVGMVLALLLYPFPSTTCGIKGDLITHKMIDLCIEKRPPVIFYLLGW